MCFKTADMSPWTFQNTHIQPKTLLSRKHSGASLFLRRNKFTVQKRALRGYILSLHSLSTRSCHTPKRTRYTRQHSLKNGPGFTISKGRVPPKDWTSNTRIPEPHCTTHNKENCLTPGQCTKRLQPGQMLRRSDLLPNSKKQQEKAYAGEWKEKQCLCRDKNRRNNGTIRKPPRWQCCPLKNKILRNTHSLNDYTETQKHNTK